MKKHTLLPLALAFAAASHAQTWNQPSPTGVAPAGTTLYYFRNQGAVLCREVEEDVWTDQRITGALARVQPVWVDASKSENRALVESLGIYVVPTTVLVEGEREVGRVKLSTSREDYLALLASAGLVSPSEYRAATPTPPPTPGTASAAPVLRAETADAPGDVAQPAFDLVALRVGNEGGNLLIHATVGGAPDESWASGLNIFIDADRSETTGYAHDLFAGADVLIQGTGVLRFGGSEPRAWLWNGAGAASVTFSKSAVAVRIPFAMLGISPDTPIRVLANTQDKSWQSLDWAPSRGFLEVPAAKPVTAAPVAPQATPADTRGDALAGFDIATASVTLGPEGLVAVVEYAGTPKFPEHVQFLFDVDGDPSTGFSSTSGTGADWLLEGASMHKYAAPQGTAWTWTQVSMGEGAKTANGWRVAIPAADAAMLVPGRTTYWVQSIDDTWNSADRMPDKGTLPLR